MTGPRIPEEVMEHYADEVREAERITDRHPLEFLRTQEIVRRHLSRSALRILDVGGAAGVHACWLAADGHRVHLVDPVPSHVEQARAASRANGVPFEASVGDALSLEHPDAAFDVVLFLGPLYHLTEAADRLRALREARRVLTAGGLLFAAGISRFASALDGLARGFLYEDGFRGIVETDLRDGQHRNPERRPSWFTTAYFHRPDQLRDEVAGSGFRVRELLGVEGLAGWLPDTERRLADARDREALLWTLRTIEREPSLLGLSAHLLLVGEKGPDAEG